jgi:pyruvate kinase
MGFDYIAASFTRDEKDILELRDALHRLNGGKIQIIAKIENADGVQNIDSIINVADGLMVARGDLGVEMPLEDIPVLQKRLIKLAYRQGKVVITATQMLESMIYNPRPTRAEVSDVANAIYDGTSAIMLSGETAAGKYPVEVVRVMALIAERTEREINYKNRFKESTYKPGTSIVNAIAHATVTTAHDLEARAILTVTVSGYTARNVAKFRPACSIIACTTEPSAVRQLSLVWGVQPILMDKQYETGALFEQATTLARKHADLKDGDLIVLTAGVPLGYSGTTNLLKVHEIGESTKIL